MEGKGIFGGGGQAVTRVKKRRLRVSRKAVVANALEAILSFFWAVKGQLVKQAPCLSPYRTKYQQQTLCYYHFEMASRALATTAFLLTLNLLFFTLVTSSSHTPKGCPPPPPPPCPPSPKPRTPSHPHKATCPKDTLKLGVCANLLNDLVHLVVGTPPKTPCCTLIDGLADLEAAVCLCTAIKANVLGINLNVPVSLSLLLNYCGKKVPSGFQCA
ncbi:hypothetical protein L1987_17764 [Smallanthus sonchifolius]|uniref:Uncharacterized protein n=1 Tax=Smallanthus sonchifolius TaxID=185202 RepID=A0ACB9J0E1_9ASTR|nr:hypothetical protein L1987_17764 [Smallanthus sonchifolius]